MDRHQRHLEQQARRLGFADLRACMRVLLDDGWSVPQLATHLDTTQAMIRRAITDHHIPQPSRRQQLARQRQRVAEQRACDRVAMLGFPSVRAYLVDRLVTKTWTLRQVEAELGVAPATLRRLLARHQVRRVAPTGRQRVAAAVAAGPATQARVVQQRRQARLTELGFATLEEYVEDRYVGRGWPRRRLCVELGLGYDWLNQQLARLGLRP
jgi:lambda repressor-like predicted transcriptional regulator